MIIYNAKSSKAEHEAIGYRSEHARVIPNGFDCERFRPDRNAAGRLRAALGIPASRWVVGLVARWHPMKDHMNLLRAAAILQASGHDLHLVMIGKGITETDRLLVSAIHDHGLGGRVSLFGERLDIAELTPAVDIACLSSAWGEGFPNVLGEAMACGVPCVTTAVGDAAWVVAEGGRSVPARDPQALSDAIRHIMELEPESRRRIGKAERQRVLEHFSLAAIDRQYTGLYLSAIESTRRRKVRS